MSTGASFVSTSAAALAADPPATPAPPIDPAAATARAHYQKGTALYDLGKYDEAVAEFEAAYQAKSDPALLYNLAQAHRLAGHAEQALHFYRTYLKRVPKPTNKAEIEGRITQLEKLVADQKTAATAPPTTTIGGGVATMPTSTAPAATTTPVVAPPPPPPPSPTSPVPPGNGTGPSPWAATQPPPTTTSPPLQPTPVGEPGLGIAATAPSPADPGRTQRLIGIALMGGGGLFLAGGITFGAMAVAKGHELEDAANARGVYDPNIQAQGKTFQTLQWVFYGLSAASIATGLIVYLKAPSATTTASGAPKKRSLIVLQPFAGPGAGGAVLQGVF